MAWGYFPVGRQLERATLDFRYRYFNRDTKPSDRVVVIEIDEQSIKLLAPSYGRWPWPRRVYKDLIEFLSLGEPAAILFDITFTEAMRGTEDDAMLAEASARAGNVSHAMSLLLDPAEDRDVPAALPLNFGERFGVGLAGDASRLLAGMRVYRDFLLPAEDYLKRIPKIHAVTVGEDSDGRYRRVPALLSYQGFWFGSLSLSGVLSTFKEPRLRVDPGGIALQDGAGDSLLRVPLAEDGTFALHFYRLDHGFRKEPFAPVIASALSLQRGEVADPTRLKVNPLELKDKIILIGASAAGLEDLKATPIHSAYPGVNLHATAISNILTGDFQLRAPPWSGPLTGVVFVVLVYLSVLFAENTIARVALPVALLGTYAAAAAFAFRSASLWLDLAGPLFVGLVALFDGLAYVTFVEGAEKKRLTSALTKYLSPAVTQKLIANGMDPRAEVGHHQELTILFSDIRGFTTLSEAFPPQIVVEHLNEYLGEMINVIFENGGTLDKFIGDAIMAFWGAPLPDEAHARRAVRCGLAMHRALARVKEIWQQRRADDIGIDVGVGVNTGKVIVGNIGSDKRLDYTVIGDNVNLASRIEGLTKQYGVSFLIGEATFEIIKEFFVCREVDSVRVKGKSRHVRIYEPLVEADFPDQEAIRRARELATRFGEAIEEYKAGRFQEAKTRFSAIQAGAPGGDGPSETYLERLEELIASPPKEWDGIYDAKSK